MTNIFDISSAAVDQIAALDPMMATGLGLAGHDAEWTDLSPDGFAAQRTFWAETLAAAEECETTDRRTEVAKRVLIDECKVWLAEIDSENWSADVNNIVSPWQGIRTVFSAAPMATVADWNDIIARLDSIDQALGSYRAGLEHGQAAGRIAAKRQIESAIEQGRVAAGDGSSFHELEGQLDTAAAEVSEIADLKPRLLAGIAHAKSSYGDMTDWFEATQLPAASENDGVGQARYVASARRFLGTEIDPHERYAWGWSEVNRLTARLGELCAQIDPNKTVAEVMDVLYNDPDRAAGTVDEFIAVMQTRQEQALADLDGSHFDVDERIREIEVMTAPAGGPTAAYYMGPSEDFSRPGRVWYPVDGRDSFPLFEEITTAYHEGFPGHHLQVGWQTAMGDALSRFHRALVWYPGSGEGWALYAERLMGELGYLEKVDYEIGLVVSQLFRSCRIVVDIGCHLELEIPASESFHPGEVWNFDLAVEFMQHVGHQTHQIAESEVIRYLGWPGQAISYKIGEQAIIDLRDEWEANGGTDLKQFHADLLSVGSVGLDLMRELVLN